MLHFLLKFQLGCILLSRRNKLSKEEHLTSMRCLFVCLPVLKKIDLNYHAIRMFSVATVPSSVLEFLEQQDYLDVWLDHIQLVTIHHLSGMQPELGFIKLLVAKSPMLEKLLIKYHPKKITDKGPRMSKDLIHFERESPKAQIIFEDPLPS